MSTEEASGSTLQEKKKPYVTLERERTNQRKKDSEKLDQIKYDGKLMEMENTLIKSQIHEVKKLKVYDENIAATMRSQSSSHLPPIRKNGSQRQQEFLKEVRHRDWPLYMNSRGVVNDVNIQRTANEELKRKLFNEKYKRYMINTKLHCKDTWSKVEELTKGKQPIVFDEYSRTMTLTGSQSQANLKGSNPKIVQSNSNFANQGKGTQQASNSDGKQGQAQGGQSSTQNTQKPAQGQSVQSNTQGVQKPAQGQSGQTNTQGAQQSGQNAAQGAQANTQAGQKSTQPGQSTNNQGPAQVTQPPVQKPAEQPKKKANDDEGDEY